MKKNIQWPLIALLISVTAFFGNVQALETATTARPGASAGYLEDITFEKTAGRERVALTVSKQPVMNTESQGGNAVMIKMEDMFIPDNLRSPRGEGILRNVIRVLPVQKMAGGRQSALVVIELKELVPYSVRQEGQVIIVDFNVSSLAGRPAAPDNASSVGQKTRTTPATAAGVTGGDSGLPRGEGEKETANYTGRPISVDFQDANVKSVLRLLSEEGGVNIVSGDDVKGTVTVQMKNTPWDQALDTVLAIKGLSKVEKDNVIIVMSKDDLLIHKKNQLELAKQKYMEEDTEERIRRVVPIKYRLLRDAVKSSIEKTTIKTGGTSSSASGPSSITADKTKTESISAEGPGDFSQLLYSLISLDAEGRPRGSIAADAKTNSLIITATKKDTYSIMDMIAKMDVPADQILIKANIVETTKDTARNLGIQWGGVFGQRAGNQSLYITPGGTGGSTVPPGSALSGGYTPASGITGIGGQGYGVNFPASSILGVGPASLGLLFGTIGGNILDLQLSALQKDGKLNILSSPSLATLDNQTASTENGEDVPVVTPATANSPATVTWKRAVLRLEITPHVIDGKNIKMTIVVKKDEADFTRSVQGNPPIIVKETTTDLVVADGETIVISGLTKQKKDNSINGVPWLKEVPVLGWLFKGEEKNESMEEVLIFITPNIMKPQEMAGIQTGP